MEIKKISKKKNNLYQILLSDNTSLSFYDDTIIKYSLLINRSFDDKTLQEMLAFNNQSAAYYKALSYIKAKLRTKKEIEDKLKKLGYTNNVVLNTIKRLEKQKYLNDDIYIKAYISDQVNLTLKGPKKISQELIKLGFKEEIVNTYIDKYSNDLWEEKIIKI
ncbi:MAG TPA: RecX family transcriptional regulator, partial [Candidatus Onthocola stercoravium]|nr:RecX family transcriptional regulator [Candidatus Onthocola stercoravium]